MWAFIPQISCVFRIIKSSCFTAPWISICIKFMGHSRNFLWNVEYIFHFFFHRGVEQYPNNKYCSLSHRVIISSFFLHDDCFIHCNWNNNSERSLVDEQKKLSYQFSRKHTNGMKRWNIDETENIKWQTQNIDRFVQIPHTNAESLIGTCKIFSFLSSIRSRFCNENIARHWTRLAATTIQFQLCWRHTCATECYSLTSHIQNLYEKKRTHRLQTS